MSNTTAKVQQNEAAATLPVARSIRRLRDIKRELQSINKEKERLEEIVKKYMGDGVEWLYSADTEELLATWKWSDQTVFDQETFATEHPRLFNKYVSKRPARRFLVK